MRKFLGGLILVTLLVPAAITAQSRDETLADIRQELTVLHVDIQRLKRELSTTGGASSASGGGSLIDRVNAIEGELQRLTSRTEDLDLRISRVVRDGTNRIGDLEFRLVELEGGDLSQLGETTTLGGNAATGSTPASSGNTGTSDTTELAMGEQADFDAAMAALDAGDPSGAAQLFATFRASYPGGPLSGQAGLLQGQALEEAGELSAAARVYLDTFSGAPQGADAPDALFYLGRALGRLGQTPEACLTLAEVEGRFPTSDAVLEAQSAMRNLGCA